jgi:hypothetical protein
VYEAACADAGQENRDEPAAMAFLFLSELVRHLQGRRAATAGYGYTLEYDIQLYFRRACAWPLAFGDPRLRVPTACSRPTPKADHLTIADGLADQRAAARTAHPR